jgi:hypothetical protein
MTRTKGNVVKEIHGQLDRAKHIYQGVSAAAKNADSKSPIGQELGALKERIGHQIKLIKAGKKDKLELHLRERSVAALKIATAPRVRKAFEKAGMSAAVVTELESVNKSLKRPNKATKRLAA